VRIGPYEVTGELGRGGAGAVYRVRTPDGRDAALKLLHRFDAVAFAAFERERRLLGSLGEEEGFVGLLDAGVSAEGPYLVMPLVPGGTLRERLQKRPLAVEETLALGVALATALGKAHERGIVHRDVKPENVLFSAWGRPLLADLGLAKHFDRGLPGASQSASLTRDGALKGTAGYMAPEQLEDASSVGPPCDVFALGAVLYECLAGRPAFPGESALEVFAQVQAGAIDPIRRPGVPRWLEQTIRGALARSPEARFADGASFARALRQRTSPRRSPVPLVVGVTVGAAALALFLIVGRPASPAAPPPVTAPPPNAAPATPAPSGLPPGLRASGRAVSAADSNEVPLLLFRLPDGSEIEMVSVPAGDFLMGTDEVDSNANERPRHVHAVERAYWIGRNDVSWGQYLAFCKATSREGPSKPVWWDELGVEWPHHPVVNVSWSEARAYCDWAKLDLPTEAEWEKAARGTDGRKYPWGNAWDPVSRCNFADASCPLDRIDMGGGEKASEYFAKMNWVWDHEHSDGYPYTSPAGSFPHGASPVGALDMAGNVWNWCEDRDDPNAYARYARGDRAPPAEGSVRVIRGGCFTSAGWHCRSTYRGRGGQEDRTPYLGFRVSLRAPK
jgi:formylglycine-generating enzyme required for sulfatase activity/serine/threonine protein kinase